MRHFRLSFNRDCQKVGGSSEHALRWGRISSEARISAFLYRYRIAFLASRPHKPTTHLKTKIPEWGIFLLRKQRGHRLFRISLGFLHLGYSRQLACRHCGGTDGPCLIADWLLAPSRFLFASGSGSPLFLCMIMRDISCYIFARGLFEIFFI